MKRILFVDDDPLLLAGLQNVLRRDRKRWDMTFTLGGEAAVEPYRLKHETACDLCAYRSVCRFDPWTMPFRKLEAKPRLDINEPR